MRRVIVAALLALSASQMSGQRLEIRDVFKQMPDSLMPYLSQNNRLDFIDFLDANMKAEVKNRLGGTSHEQFAAHRPLSAAALCSSRLCQRCGGDGRDLSR